MMEYNEGFPEHLEDYIKQNYEVYDRFTFDYLFRNLLQDGYDHEEAKDIITHNCALSTLVMQERIYNGYYWKISLNDRISDDLLELMNEIFNKCFKNANQKKRNGFKITLRIRSEAGGKRSLPEAESAAFAGCEAQSAEQPADGNPQRCRGREASSTTREYIKELGITEVVQNELESIMEEECIDYAYNLVLNRTYEGYTGEIQTIYGQLQEILGVKIHPAPDIWDRTYNVDFYIEVKDKYIGLQIKPISSVMALDQYQWDEIQESTHKKFTNKFGGKVFIIFSIKVGNKKKIHNIEVISEIEEEIKRLQD